MESWDGFTSSGDSQECLGKVGTVVRIFDSIDLDEVLERAQDCGVMLMEESLNAASRILGVDGVQDAVVEVENHVVC